VYHHESPGVNISHSAPTEEYKKIENKINVMRENFSMITKKGERIEIKNKM